MKKLLFLLFISFVAKAQSVQGTLINSETKEPIAYATVKINDLKKSILSKTNGTFSLDEELKENSLIEIEAWGFEKKQITLSDLKKNKILELTESVEMLPELIIPPANAKISYKNYGRTNEGSGMMVAEAQTYRKEDYDKGTEFGIIVSNKGLSELQSFHIHLKENQAKKLILRLQFYDVKNGKPNNRINHEEILLSITNKDAGWLVLDLTEKNIFIDSDISKFAFTLKLVDAEFDSDYASLLFNISASLSNQIIGRDSEFEEWTKIPMSIPMYVKAKVYK
ncbi:carboxypeptidase-like regulatory domain-containing protein [Flavobacterium sp. I3-2]|uniref:carboxypeptidase-like regulatory domain-containing protein n=1 Tax=Flavobacterium sp. I3-2 TaxID=2748319 RepID=UPI0015AF8E56|nr:carboxypeptidase-like regulatory domain-containing protein [Flavobacterium sp. I3-2]